MKIPKKIHYTWFSDDPFPLLVQNCINSWEKYLLDYEFIKWDFEKVKNIDNIFLQQALKEKKWAFASDFVRLYSVYNYGGIYLDTDVEVYKDFKELLSYKCFIGKENSFHLQGREVVSYLTSHCFGAEKNNSFIQRCLSYYECRSFIMSSNIQLPNVLRLDMTLLPYIQAVIAKEEGWNWSYENKTVFHNKNIVIFPSNYFDALSINSISFCKHLALGSWRESRAIQDKITLKFKIKWRIIKVLEVLLNRLGYIIIKAK
ncbi:glycosyltransferase family 32 protein [Chryseobacterium sp. T1]